MSLFCPLCRTLAPRPFHAESFGDRYWHCPHCDLRFLHPRHRLSPADEAAEYRAHHNDPNDARYRAFLQPLVDVIAARLPRGADGLDFGSGPGPLLPRMLEELGYRVALYDPLFSPDESVLEARYAFIVASEVAEHFPEPRRELARLRALLKPGGRLALMTLRYHAGIDFRNWHYRRERTHIAFYSAECLTWIADRLGFQGVELAGERIAILSG